jgi:uncharacterized SAM-binding protein YcdF (DUF218 family)
LLFVLSKVVWELIQPSHVLLALLACGVLLGRSRWARLGYWSAATGTALLVAITLLPIPNLLLATLEDRFPSPQHLPDHVDGIIVLGGAIDPVETAARGIPSLNEAAERMTAFVKLARLYPSATKLFTGGNGTLQGAKISEAAAAKMLFAELGLDTGQIVFEDQSRNTYENAVFSRQLIRSEANQIWILVTSAAHLPRAVGIFRKLGWPVIPYPVAYKSDGDYLGDLTGALGIVDAVAREWVGLVAYRILDRTDALIPGGAQEQR